MPGVGEGAGLAGMLLASPGSSGASPLVVKATYAKAAASNNNPPTTPPITRPDCDCFCRRAATVAAEGARARIGELTGASAGWAVGTLPVGMALPTGEANGEPTGTAAPSGAAIGTAAAYCPSGVGGGKYMPGAAEAGKATGAIGSSDAA